MDFTHSVAWQLGSLTACLMAWWLDGLMAWRLDGSKVDNLQPGGKANAPALMALWLLRWSLYFFNCVQIDVVVVIIVASCYKIRVLWYLLTVLTYQSHLNTHFNPRRNPTWSHQDFGHSTSSSIAELLLFCLESLQSHFRSHFQSHDILFESCQNHFLVRV